MSVEFTYLARDDIDLAIEELHLRFGSRTSDMFQRRLDETLELLRRNPLMVAPIDPPYPRYPDLRVLPVCKFKGRLICFVPTCAGIRVVRVLLSSRDLDAIFGS